ncbi:polysaccharide biosynthesis protein [SAR86 cluster bacterium SAR86E]|uniref:Polysaccharide biosynthesis protein n=1 Tax=SAR86 cluster bacterium SAR86E TaxID=1208365 RepID=K6FBJ8_9GAMM|nr:polysaccharide biosynthesis protein [SAR86 cluster bacterium SAR86E]
MNKMTLLFQSFSRKQKIFIVLLNDLIIALVCWIVFGPPMATFIASEFSESIIGIFYKEWRSFIIPISLSISYLYLLGFYKSLIKFFDSKDSILLAISGSMIFGFSWSLLHIFQFSIISTSFLSIAILQGFLLSAVFYAFLNISRDIAKYLLYPRNINLDAKPVIIYGAGASGNELFQSLMLDPSRKLIAFFDNSKNLKDTQINNIPILSSMKQLIALKNKFHNLEVLLAIPSIDTKKRREIIHSLEKIRVAVRTVPSFHELISDQKKMTDIQNLSIDDLLPRARVEKNVLGSLQGSNILISGAGGSIGSEISRQLLDSNPKTLILLDLSEFNLFTIERECIAIKETKELTTEIVPLLADIKDRTNLESIFIKYNLDSIYHAAAYKHVPLVENINNITKACENNILGTYHLASLAIECKAKSFVMISTDKAVRPTNVMGASKRMAEMVIQSMNASSSSTKFSMVRFGNVLNSSGSVIPLFLEQIAQGGPVTVTHRDVTRYFMTIPEASNLVLQASQLSTGGEVFILDMGEQMKIYDLAQKLIHLSGRNIALAHDDEGIEIIEIGLRPGEKMYEELLISGEEMPTQNKKIFKSLENFPDLKQMNEILDSLSNAISLNNVEDIIDLLEIHIEGFHENS